MGNDIDSCSYDFVFLHHNKDYVQSPFLLRYLKTKTVYYCAEPQRVFYDEGLFRMIYRKKKNNEIRSQSLYTR